MANRSRLREPQTWPASGSAPDDLGQAGRITASGRLPVPESLVGIHGVALTALHCVGAGVHHPTGGLWVLCGRPLHVRAIRRLATEGATVRALAGRFGIGKTTAWQVIVYATWRHVDDGL